jgi:hypothetical protein
MSTNMEQALGQVVSPPFFGGANLAKNLDLYISTAGNDNNPGTQASPFLTIARARTETLKYAFLDQVRIFFLTAGSYVQVDWDGSRYIGNGVRAGRLCFIANESTRTILFPATNPAAGSTTVLMNTPALGGTNNFRRFWVVRRNSLGVVLDERLIVANTNTTITPSTAFRAAPAITDTFEIVSPGVILTSPVNNATYYSNFRGSQAILQPFLARPIAGIFFVNVRLPNTQFYNSYVYGKEVETIFPIAVFFPTAAGISTVDYGWITTFAGISLNAFPFLGQSNDEEWYGAGVSSTSRIDIPPGESLIRGFACVSQVAGVNAANNGPRGTLELYGGALTATTSPAIDLTDSYGVLKIVRDRSDNVRVQITASGATPGVRFRARDRSSILIQNANIQITNGDALQNLSPNNEVQLDNTVLTGATAAGNGVVTRYGGRISHLGLPVITGAGGGNFDNLLADPVPVGNANAFFAAAGIGMTSALGSWITRIE